MSNEQDMSIDEVDQIIELGNPTTGIPAYIVGLATVGIYAIGLYGMMNAIKGNINLINLILPLIASFLAVTFPILAVFGLLVFLVAIIGSILLLILVRKAARVVLYAVLFLMPIVLIGVGALLMVSGIFYGIVSIGFGLLFFLLFFVYRKRLELAARALQLSAQAILDEKGAILASFVSALFGMITFLFLVFASIYVGDSVLTYTQDQNYALLASGVVFFLGSWSVSFVSYLMYGTISGIVHDWYRSPRVDVASFGKGLKRALRVKGGIALYSLLMVTLRFIVEYLRGRARRSRSLVDVVAASVAGIVSGIIQFITIYAVPAMVIRRTGFKNGVKDSWSKLKDLFIETLAGNFGFGYVMFIFAIIMMIFYGAVGYFIGAYVLHPIIVNLYGIIGSPSATGLISAIGFLVIGLIPTILIFNTLSVAFTTILYEFGLDIEFARRGIVLPKRLPKDIEESFRAILAERGVKV